MENTIKQIQVKLEDGTFSEPLPIGADAKNVEMEGGKSNAQVEIDTLKEQLLKLTKVTEILELTNLDTILENGRYICITDEVAASLINCPIQKGFVLDVSSIQNTSIIKQEIEQNEGAIIYKRTIKDNLPSEWKTFYSKDTLPIASNTILGGIKVGENLIMNEDGTLDSKEYTLPVASPSSLGGIKVGEGLEIGSDGLLKATAQGGTEYTLPPASTSTLGGIKVGKNLTVENDGTLNGEKYVLPMATNSTLGGIKIGDNLIIDDNGVISAPNFGDLYFNFSLWCNGEGWDDVLGNNLNALGRIHLSTIEETNRWHTDYGIRIVDYANSIKQFEGHIPNQIFKKHKDKGFILWLEFLDRDGVKKETSKCYVKIDEEGNLLMKGFYVGEKNDGSEIDYNDRSPISPATPNKIGGIRVGDGLSIDAEGVLSVKSASNSGLGGIKVGKGLKMNPDGTLDCIVEGEKILYNLSTINAKVIDTANKIYTVKEISQ